MTYGFREKGPVGEEGLCQMCHQHPAEVYGLVCPVCKEAIDAGEPWTLEHEDLLDQLQEAELEEQYT